MVRSCYRNIIDFLIIVDTQVPKYYLCDCDDEIFLELKLKKNLSQKSSSKSCFKHKKPFKQ